MENNNGFLEDLKILASLTEQKVTENNIYSNSTFEILHQLSEKIWQIADETNTKAADVMKQAGIRDPYVILTDAMKEWDKKLQMGYVLTDTELANQLQKDCKLRVSITPVAYVPTDDSEIAPSDESVDSKNIEGNDANRVAIAIHVLLNMDLDDIPIRAEDLRLTKSETPANSWRNRSYWSIDIPKKNILILVNNQYGNITFVAAYRDAHQREDLEMATKANLKAKAKNGYVIHYFEFNNEDEFRKKIEKAILDARANCKMMQVYETVDEAMGAAQRLGIKTPAEYISKYKEDPRLPSNPDKKYGDKWPGWPSFLRNEIKKTYETVEEAMNAAQRLGIQTLPEYETRYKEDPRLPSNPNISYRDKWPGWPSFLRNETKKIKKPYETVEEAMNAAQRLGIKSSVEYKTRYKEDPRLPSAPDVGYGDKWPGWPKFLGNEIKEPYETVEEAMGATQRLGIKTSIEYITRYKEDPRLPSSPFKKFGDKWPGWPYFLGKEIKEFYETVEEAMGAAQHLDIKSSVEYKTRYKEDPRLPSAPDVGYGDKWPGWPSFLGKNKIQVP